MENRTTDQPPARKSKRTEWIVMGVVTAVVAALVLAGGVLAANRLAAPGRRGEGGFFGGPRPEFQITPAAELPTAAPSISGVVTARDGQTLSVGQRGNQTTRVVDVLVTASTKIYHDITARSFQGQPPSGAVQQQLEAGTLDGVATNSRVTVWGAQSGNQVTADVLVYTDPFGFRAP